MSGGATGTPPANLGAIERDAVGLVLRRYRAEDNDAVRELHRVALQAVGALGGPGPWDDDLSRIAEVYLDGRGEFLVGLLQGRIVAMGALRWHEQQTAEVKRMRCIRRSRGVAMDGRCCAASRSVRWNSAIAAWCWTPPNGSSPRSACTARPGTWRRGASRWRGCRASSSPSRCPSTAEACRGLGGLLHGHLVSNLSAFSVGTVEGMSGVQTGPGATHSRGSPGRSASGHCSSVSGRLRHQVATGQLESHAHRSFVVPARPVVLVEALDGGASVGALDGDEGEPRGPALGRTPDQPGDAD